MREWIEGAQAIGADRAAFAELVAQFAPRVRDFLHRSGAPEERVERAVQAVMRALWTEGDPQGAGVADRVFALARDQRAALMDGIGAGLGAGLGTGAGTGLRLDPATAFAPSARGDAPMPSLAAVEARLQRIQEQLRRARLRQSRPRRAA